jgi:cell division septation protein DedD
LNPTAASIDKEAVRWSLSWLPAGRCDSFTKGAIRLFAPGTSGVYGLFNSDCQVFIGESANIQEALLRHERETDFRSQRLRPTGFTFEPCAAELRKYKADELIAKFHPVLQTEAALTQTWSAPNDSRVSEAGLGGHEETYSDHQEFPSHEHEKQSKVRRHFYFKGRYGAALAAMFITSAMVIFYFDTPSGKNVQRQADEAEEKLQERTSITQLPTGGQTKISLRPGKVSSIATDGGIANQSAEPTPAKPDVHASASTSNIGERFFTKSTPAADRAGISAKTSPMAHSSGSASLSKKWSVQVAAPPAKDIADTLLQRLKAKGYDGYVLQVEVKGQRYYRVRVGYFDSREKAEAVHQSLMREGSYRDAYLTGD